MLTLERYYRLVIQNWTPLRWLRLGLGLFIGFQSIQAHDALAGSIAAFFLFQAVTNTGCCGNAVCASPADAEKTNQPKEVAFEEIRSERNRQ